jgi:hypothetical protein
VDRETLEVVYFLVGIIALFVCTCAVGVAAAIRRR